jgi:protein-disulfide isomerase
MKKSSLFTFLVLFMAFAGGAAQAADDTSKPLAKVGDTVLTEDQLRQDMAMQLYQMENNMYQLKKSWIDQKAQNILFDKAAKAAGMSRAKWEAKEIDAKVPVPDAAVVQQMASRMTRPGMSSTETLKMASEYMANQNKQNYRNQVYQELARTTPVEVMLVKPEAPRVNVTYAADDPVKGNAKAPVTIVEFTDFQCPYCQRSQSTLKQVEETYPNDVKIVARQYPLPFHNRAKPAAEAAMCAKEQGKFWEYRDKLFDKQQLNDEDFRRYAKELNLNSGKFEKCLASHKYAERIEKDIAEGQKFGVTGTPAFFVNGEMINGAQPFPSFQTAIQGALSNSKKTN